MISVETAKKKILSSIKSLSVENIPLTDAGNRVLGKEFKSLISNPPNDISSMDGYAIIAKDVIKNNKILKIIDSSPAGKPSKKLIKEGETIRVFTGSVIPKGADTVVIQENVTKINNTIRINVQIKYGENIRKKSMDFFKGSNFPIIKGTVLKPQDLALAASMNKSMITVQKKPNVAIISTGDEIIELGKNVEQNKIISSSNLAISSIISNVGGNPVYLGNVSDNKTQITKKIKESLKYDLIITIGGMSVGDHDLVRPTLEKLDLKTYFWKVAMRPGKPLMYGKIHNTPLLGLPGNPVSAIVCTFIFIIPMINKFLGKKNITYPTSSAILGNDLPKNDSRQDYLRGYLIQGKKNKKIVSAFNKQDSSMLSILSRSDCLIIRKPYAKAARKGDSVKILNIRDSNLFI